MDRIARALNRRWALVVGWAGDPPEWAAKPINALGAGVIFILAFGVPTVALIVGFAILSALKMVSVENDAALGMSLFVHAVLGLGLLWGWRRLSHGLPVQALGWRRQQIGGTLKWFVIGVAASFPMFLIGIFTKEGDWPEFLPLLATAFFSLIALAVSAAYEEALFRGAIMRGLITQYGGVVGVVASSTIFAFCHLTLSNGVFDLLKIANTFAMGVAFALIALRTGGLLAPFAVHLGWNFTATMAQNIAGGPGSLTEMTNVQAEIELGNFLLTLVFVLAGCAFMGWMALRQTPPAPREGMPTDEAGETPRH